MTTTTFPEITDLELPITMTGTHQPRAALRREQLSQWVTLVLSEGNVRRQVPLPLQAIGSDAGFRKYYRVQTPKQTLVAVDAPPTTEDTHTFVDIAHNWRAKGVSVPQVFAVDYEQGFMLQEDLGDTPMQAVLNKTTADEYYPKLLTTLLSIQQQASENLPLYDEKLMRFELSLYSEWFLQALLGITPPAELAELFSLLIAAMKAQPQGTVHRDYHSRNLMLTPIGDIGVIDFQGALYGPLLYDVVSLLRDCYLSWPTTLVERWFSEFIARHPVLSEYDPVQLQIWFDLTGIQRHLKCLGIFSRLWLRDDKPGYLKEIPRTLDYVICVCHRYPQLSGHAQWLEQYVVPAVRARLKQVIQS